MIKQRRDPKSQRYILKYSSDISTRWLELLIPEEHRHLFDTIEDGCDISRPSASRDAYIELVCRPTWERKAYVIQHYSKPVIGKNTPYKSVFGKKRGNQ